MELTLVASYQTSVELMPKRLSIKPTRLCQLTFFWLKLTRLMLMLHSHCPVDEMFLMTVDLNFSLFMNDIVLDVVLWPHLLGLKKDVKVKYQNR